MAVSPLPHLYDLQAAMAADGFAFVHGPVMRELIASAGPLRDWPAFADSWNHLALDTYMADGGRYRRRRHAVYAAPAGGAIVRAPHQPHYQSRDYNGRLVTRYEPSCPSRY